MPRDTKETISAQVVLRPASGKAVGQSAITAENIADYAPSPDAVARTTRAFGEAGFEVGPVVGTSFSITAPLATFEKVFDLKLQRDERGGLKAVSGKGKPSYELPMPKLSKDVVEQIEAVTFTRPPDFGPSSY
jgi:hypothetical protein